MDRKRLPVTLVTGFLGSGKTTLLRRIAEDHRGEKLVFLVNELSPRDVDGALLSETTASVIPLPGGSIFCRCLVSEFMSKLRAVREEHGDAIAVVIEASGIADPRAMSKMLSETRLDKVFELSQIICVVDPRTLLKLQVTLPNIRSQIAAADLVVVNKVDRASADEIKESLELIRTINPGAAIRQTRHCEIDVTFKMTETCERPDGEYAPCRDPDFATFTTRTHAENLDLIRHVIEKHAAIIYRAKGFIASDSGEMLYVDYSGGVFKADQHPSITGKAGELVWIVQGKAAGEIQRELEPFFVGS